MLKVCETRVSELLEVTITSPVKQAIFSSKPDHIRRPHTPLTSKAHFTLREELHDLDHQDAAEEVQKGSMTVLDPTARFGFNVRTWKNIAIWTERSPCLGRSWSWGHLGLAGSGTRYTLRCFREYGPPSSGKLPNRRRLPWRCLGLARADGIDEERLLTAISETSNWHSMLLLARTCHGPG